MDLAYPREVLRSEAEAISSLIPKLTDSFIRAAKKVLECRGRIAVSGMGKAGLIGGKLSATLASTGTPSLPLHPAEALHGELGRVRREDIILALSNSGETEEILRLIPAVRKIGCGVISITAQASSSLGKLSDIVLEIGKIEEACPLKLAPSASTAAMLALGDALALAVQKERGFNKEQFAFLHPAGDIGRRLLKVSEVMRTGDKNPLISVDTPVVDALKQITDAHAGAVCIINGKGSLAGIFTDGDLRRNIGRLNDKVGDVMTRKPITIGPDRLATEAARMAREKKIDEIPVVNDNGEPVGLVDIQDLLAVGLI